MSALGGKGREAPKEEVLTLGCVKHPRWKTRRVIFLGPIKSTTLGNVRVANRDPEKYLFYRVLGATRFYTAKTRRRP